MADGIVVSSEEVLKAGGAVKPHNFLQAAGVKLAIWVGTVGALAIFVMLAKWWSTYPSPPVLPNGFEPDKAKALLDYYRQLQEISTENLLKMCDAVVVKVLLPVFTSILGYIFGSREK